ncbi:hypothetical protein OIU78_001784 [Salix suchowensis]|nr:hypothetical protein OIU78_001784 [Salix suchowensis]
MASIVQELLGDDNKTCPAEENVEAICQFFNTIGKQLDKNPEARQVNEVYFSRMKEVTTNPQLAPRFRFMVRDVLDLRANSWVPRREEGKCENFFLVQHTFKTEGFKTIFSVQILDEALQCVEELKDPAFHPEVAKEAISLALEKSPPCVGPVIKLLEFLLTKKALTARDIGTGCLLYGSLLDDIGIDLPKALNNFGEVLGNLVVVQGLDFEVLKELLEKVEDNRFRKAIFDCAMESINSNPSGQEVGNTGF